MGVQVLVVVLVVAVNLAGVVEMDNQEMLGGELMEIQNRVIKDLLELQVILDGEQM